MEENKTTVPVVEKEATTTSNGATAENKTFSQDDVNGLIGRTKAEEKAKHEKAMTEAVRIAIEEERRQAKLSEDERENERKAKASKELQERENAITMRERKIEALEMLASKNIPTNLVDFVLDLDSDKVKANIDRLSTSYNDALTQGINEKLKGNTPKDFTSDAPKPKKINGAF